MMNRVDVYGKDRNEPYIEITLNDSEIGTYLAESLLARAKEAAMSALQEGDLKRTRKLIEFAADLQNAVKEVRGEKD